MNREQCQAILAHLDLIRHFAEGGDIGHRAPNCAGEMMPIHVARGIGLSGLKPDGSTWYLRLKPRYRYDNRTKSMVRVPRSAPERPTMSEVILCPGSGTDGSAG